MTFIYIPLGDGFARRDASGHGASCVGSLPRVPRGLSSCLYAPHACTDVGRTCASVREVLLAQDLSSYPNAERVLREFETWTPAELERNQRETVDMLMASYGFGGRG